MKKRIDIWMGAGGYPDGAAWGGVAFVVAMYVLFAYLVIAGV